MQHPLQITIRDLPSSATLTQEIREKASKLEQFCEKIQSCHVVIDMPQKNQHQGKIYNVRIDIKVPKDELNVNHIRDENVYVALRDAFNAARRKLLKHMSKKRGDVKTHANGEVYNYEMD